MDFRYILSEIEKTDPEVYDRVSDRRKALRSFGAKVAVAALPIAIGSMFKKAYGKTTDVVLDALNFALELEYFEYNFYHIANNVAGLGLIPAADQAGFLAIEAHEKGHLNFLKTTITTMGGTPFTPKHYTAATSTPPYVPAAYDFTASANTVYFPVFEKVFTNYADFLIAAQTFEDMHIRAVGGQMSTFTNGTLFGQAQQLLATEGRHAAYVRLKRRNMGAAEKPAPWINNNIPPAPNVPSSTAVLQPFYDGEENVTQSGMAINALAGVTGTIQTLSATAAFDEPLSKAKVTTLIAPFLLP